MTNLKKGKTFQTGSEVYEYYIPKYKKKDVDESIPDILREGVGTAVNANLVTEFRRKLEFNRH